MKSFSRDGQAKLTMLINKTRIAKPLLGYPSGLCHPVLPHCACFIQERNQGVDQCSGIAVRNHDAVSVPIYRLA
jgi:hypothetical protein